MSQNSNDYEIIIKKSLDNVKARIKILNEADKKSILEEYKEWIRDGISAHTVLLLREDPII